MRFIAQWLPVIFGLAGTFAGLMNQIGFLSTTLIAIVVALMLWILANRVIEKVSPQTTSEKIQSTPTQSTHSVCDVGPYKVNGGEFRNIALSIKQGQRLRGHLAEMDNQPFDWFISDEKNMVNFKNGQNYKPIDEGRDAPAYRINRKIPWQARWYLILDMFGKQNYREVRADFEPVSDL